MSALSGGGGVELRAESDRETALHWLLATRPVRPGWNRRTVHWPRAARREEGERAWERAVWESTNDVRRGRPASRRAAGLRPALRARVCRPCSRAPWGSAVARGTRGGNTNQTKVDSMASSLLLLKLDRALPRSLYPFSIVTTRSLLPCFAVFCPILSLAFFAKRVRATTLRATAPHTLPTLLLHSTPSACITLGS